MLWQQSAKRGLPIARRDLGVLGWLYEHRHGADGGESVLGQAGWRGWIIVHDLSRCDFGAVSQEYVNGQLKNKYGDAFIRGNNGEHEHTHAHGARVAL